MAHPVRSVLRWTVRVYLAYLLLCLVVVLPALNILTPRILKDAVNRDFRSELILFNPFSLTLEVRGATLTETSGHQPLGFRKLRTNLSMESIWQPGIVLDAFSLEGLDLHVLRESNGDFHFADLIAEQPAPVEEPAGAVPGITIHNLLIDAHTLRFTDRSRPGAYTTVQRDLRVETRNLTTVPGRQGAGDLRLTGDGGGQLSWSGELQLAEGISSGRIGFEAIDLTHAWRYSAESLPFAVESARFDAVLNYAVDWSGDLQFSLNNSALRLHNVDIEPAVPAELPDTALILDDLSVDGIDFDLASQSVAISSVAATGLDLRGYDEAGKPSLLALFGVEEPSSDPDAVEETATDQTDPPASEWSLALTRLSLSDSEVHWRTEFLEPERLLVSPFSLSTGKLQWPAEDETPFEVALTVNERPELSIIGSLNVGSGNGSTQLTLTEWPLPWLNPVVTAQARTDISRGLLSLTTAVVLREFVPITVNAGIKVSDFGTQLHATGQEAFTLASLSIDDAAVNLEQQTVSVAEIALRQPSGSLHILEDGTINVNGIVRGQTVEGDAPVTDNAPDASTEGAPDESADEQPWRVELAHFLLRDGRLNFADDSLPLPFKTLIDDIEADLYDLDSGSATPLTAELTGSIDGYAPVVIQGSGHPLGDPRDGELRFSFRGVDIATMSPYSGTYAGYSIDSGTLSLDLSYTLQGQQLKGDNRIVISQMQLGEPVESELAIDVPLKLGLALLTDSKGVIDLSVPISGDIASPDFSLGPVIGQTIKNIIVKAVSAPFSLLAGLVGSKEDLKNIGFEAGSERFESDALDALDALAEALKKRPQLNLRIAGGSDPAADGRALKSAMLQDALLAQGLTAEAIAAQGEDYNQAIEQRFAELQLSAPADAAAQETPQGEPVEPSVATMRDALIDQYTLPRGALQELGTARAAAAKRALVTEGAIDAARIAIAYDAGLLASSVQMDVDA